jgi:hypothetical protein
MQMFRAFQELLIGIAAARRNFIDAGTRMQHAGDTRASAGGQFGTSGPSNGKRFFFCEFRSGAK